MVKILRQCERCTEYVDANLTTVFELYGNEITLCNKCNDIVNRNLVDIIIERD